LKPKKAAIFIIAPSKPRLLLTSNRRQWVFETWPRTNSNLNSFFRKLGVMIIPIFVMAATSHYISP
jgi:hypothetical protein